MQKLVALENSFSICRLKSTDGIDLTSAYTFVGVTNNVVSLVCDTKNVPSNTLNVSSGWRALQIDEDANFKETSVLAKVSSILVDYELALYAISTCGADYMFLKGDDFDMAFELLVKEGYEID